jgi:A/G-specific adenine glycosylase
VGELTVKCTFPLSPEVSLLHYRVAAGIIVRKNRILIGQRLPHSFMGGLWEFPGGKQEAGETLEECLRREIREELDIDVCVGSLLAAAEHTYEHFHITLYAFHCHYLSGEPKPKGVADFRWVTLADLSSYTFSPADLKILAALKKSSPLHIRPLIRDPHIRTGSD